MKRPTSSTSRPGSSFSPNSKQVVVTSGHDVVWNETSLVLDEILTVLAATGDSAAG